MLRWMALFALVAMVAFVGCGPKSDGGADQPDASGGDTIEETTESAVEEGSAAVEEATEAVEDAAEAVEEAAEDTAEAAEDELGDLADEFADFEVQGGSSASAQR